MYVLRISFTICGYLNVIYRMCCSVKNRKNRKIFCRTR